MFRQRKTSVAPKCHRRPATSQTALYPVHSHAARGRGWISRPWRSVARSLGRFGRSPARPPARAFRVLRVSVVPRPVARKFNLGESCRKRSNLTARGRNLRGWRTGECAASQANQRAALSDSATVVGHGSGISLCLARRGWPMCRVAGLSLAQSRRGRGWRPGSPSSSVQRPLARVRGWHVITAGAA